MKKALEQFLKEKLIKKENGIKFDQIEQRIKRAKIDIDNAKMLLKKDETGAFKMAYDSMLQAGLSLVLSYGYRPRVQGFHKIVVDFTKMILGNKYSVLVRQFDQMRRNRNEAIYDIGFISFEEAKESISIAQELIKEIIKHINKNNPQKKLL